MSVALFYKKKGHAPYFQGPRVKVTKVLIPEATHWETERLIELGLLTGRNKVKQDAVPGVWSIGIRRTPPVTVAANAVERPIAVTIPSRKTWNHHCSSSLIRDSSNALVLFLSSFLLLDLKVNMCSIPIWGNVPARWANSCCYICGCGRCVLFKANPSLHTCVIKHRLRHPLYHHP
jgi:hypothetical protein